METANKQTNDAWLLVFCATMAMTAIDGIGLFAFCVAAAILPVLYSRIQNKAWIWLGIGMAVAYLARCVVYTTFTNPSYLVYSLLLPAFALPLMLTAQKKIPRTAVILMLTATFTAVLIGYLLSELYWHWGSNAIALLWEKVYAWEDEMVNAFFSLPVESINMTEQELRLLLQSVKLLLPSVLILFSLTFAYLTTAMLGLFCRRGNTTAALSDERYEITMSAFSAVLFLVIFIFTFCLSLPNGIFAAVLENIRILLTPGFCYIEIRRLIFRIRNRQMDYFSWMWIILLVLSFGYALQYLALFGAFHVIGSALPKEPPNNDI